MVKKDFRRTRMVNKSLQYRFLAMILIYSASLVLFLALALFVPDIVQMGDQRSSLDVQAAAADRLLARHLWVWPGALVLILIISVHSFRSFWRVAGPLYRFQMAFDQVRGGDLSHPVRLRAQDYLHSEVKTLNEMLRALAEKLGGLQQAGVEALKSFKELEKHAAASGSNRNDTHQALLDAHRRHLEGLVEAARYFQVQRAEPAAAPNREGDGGSKHQAAGT